MGSRGVDRFGFNAMTFHDVNEDDVVFDWEVANVNRVARQNCDKAIVQSSVILNIIG